MQLSPEKLIAHKRDGQEHSKEAIASLIEQFMAGDLTDYQMTAWLMAAYLNGLTDREMVALTEAMLFSGRSIRHPNIDGPIIDKHSTGGVGDKLSLALAPLAAECGVFVPMISGRGLGHTGGTLDKLESIRGYDTRLGVKRFCEVVERVGVSIIGQTEDIAPADRRIYALRDVTGTVACRPLIVASILSKKLAAGLDALVLDVKVGRGAFMKDPQQARDLAHSLVHVAGTLGTPACALLTDMNLPLGRTIGNALEVREAIDILRGDGPADTTELSLALAQEMLLLGNVAASKDEARAKLDEALGSGRALERLGRMIEAHDGDPRVVERPSLLPSTRTKVEVVAPTSGKVQDIDPLILADVALSLGAGRMHAEASIDHAVGVEIVAPLGTEVHRGEPVALLHSRDQNEALANRAAEAFRVGPDARSTTPLVLGRIAGGSQRPS